MQEWRDAGCPAPVSNAVVDLAGSDQGAAGTIVAEGVCPPEWVLALASSLPPQPDGYSPALIVVQEDPIELLGALTSRDLSAVIADPRVTIVVGPGASKKLGDLLRRPESLERSMPTRVMRSPALRVRASPALEHVLADAAEVQGAEHARARAEVLRKSEGRDRAWWSSRYESALSPGSEHPGLRVLVLSSRYSTFVRHAATDLADSLCAAGHAAEVLMEPDDHSRLATPAYLRAVERMDPDLVVLINYTRRHLGQALPPNVPFVCWVQDRMAHLFDPACGAAQGELDFLFGHLHADLFTHFGYPARNRRFSFVPASARKFHDGAADPLLLRRHRCDIAYASHQSETPERFHQRIAPMFATAPAVRASLDVIRAMAVARLDALDAGSPVTPRIEMVRAALGEAGLRNPDERLVLTVDGQYAVPLLERMHRHRTLSWVAAQARRRGWSLRLYGRGWESHPELGEFARGALDHGHEELRCVYRAASVNLHISLNSNAHQRVYECALSGGLMLRRGASPDAETAKAAFISCVASTPAAAVNPDGSTVHEVREGGPLAAVFHALRGTSPGAGDSVLYRREFTPEVRARLLAVPRAPIEMLPDYSFPAARETLFRTPDELDAAVGRAGSDREWRERTIAEHRETALRYCTCDAAAASMLGMVRASLRGEVVL